MTELIDASGGDGISLKVEIEIHFQDGDRGVEGES